MQKQFLLQIMTYTDQGTEEGCSSLQMRPFHPLPPNPDAPLPPHPDDILAFVTLLYINMQD